MQDVQPLRHCCYKPGHSPKLQQQLQAVLSPAWEPTSQEKKQHALLVIGTAPQSGSGTLRILTQMHNKWTKWTTYVCKKCPII